MRRPYRDSGGIIRAGNPALKRWANYHCAYGAGHQADFSAGQLADVGR
jgi:hypothetical protein